jgi:hypothetical protein
MRLASGAASSRQRLLGITDVFWPGRCSEQTSEDA